MDCGPCSVCGDGKCSGYDEGCWTCPKDCGECNGGPCCEPHDGFGCDNPKITDCVCSMDPYCCQAMWDDICVSEVQQCGLDCEPCQPSCITSSGQKKQCGDDGCGGQCGYCPAGWKCDQSSFKCVYACAPSCQGKECGSDGCGGSCGACAPGEACVNGVCSGNTKTCADVLNCAIDCGFAPQCTFGCYGDASPTAKQVFQSLSMCVIQDCGWNVTAECVKESLSGACADLYNKCMNTP